MIFEELVLAPLVPGRVPKTRENSWPCSRARSPFFWTTASRLSSAFSGASSRAHPRRSHRKPQPRRAVRRTARNPACLSKQPALAGLPDQSHARARRVDRLFARPGRPAHPGRNVRGNCCARIIQDELRVLLGFWLEMPVQEYLDDLETVGRPWRRRSATALPVRWADTETLSSPLNLKGLIAGTDPGSHDSAEEIAILLGTIEDVRQARAPVAEAGTQSRFPTRRESTRQLDARRGRPGPLRSRGLARALSLRRRIIGLSDERFRKNVDVGAQPIMDRHALRPVFFDAHSRSSAERTGRSRSNFTNADRETSG